MLQPPRGGGGWRRSSGEDGRADGVARQEGHLGDGSSQEELKEEMNLFHLQCTFVSQLTLSQKCFSPMCSFGHFWLIFGSLKVF